MYEINKGERKSRETTTTTTTTTTSKRTPARCQTVPVQVLTTDSVCDDA